MLEIEGETKKVATGTEKGVIVGSSKPEPIITIGGGVGSMTFSEYDALLQEAMGKGPLSRALHERYQSTEATDSGMVRSRRRNNQP